MNINNNTLEQMKGGHQSGMNGKVTPLKFDKIGRYKSLFITFNCTP